MWSTLFVAFKTLCQLEFEGSCLRSNLLNKLISILNSDFIFYAVTGLCALVGESCTRDLSQLIFGGQMSQLAEVDQSEIALCTFDDPYR